MRSSILLALACAGASSLAASPVKKIIVLMQENRAFDHFLGHLKQVNPQIDGLTPASGNPTNPLDPTSPWVPVNYNAVDGGPTDPCHSFDCVTQQIYGFQKPMTNNSFTPKMDGFVANTPGGAKNVPFVMSAFNSVDLPILSTLATEFAVFDHWHCAVPSCTNPNREYMMSGTSWGHVDNTFPPAGFPQESHFHFLQRNNVTWKIYWSDDPWMAPAFADLRTADALTKVQQIQNFFWDLGNGTLPSFSLIQPRMATTSKYGVSNWQHPDGSVSEGERLVQEALSYALSPPPPSSIPSLSLFLSFTHPRPPPPPFI